MQTNETNTSRPPKLALVFASGGLRPLGGVELIRFFNEEGIKPDLVIGCSGGAAVAAGLALEWTYEEAKKKIFEGLPRDLGHLFDLKKINDFIKIPSPNFSPTKSFIEGPVWVDSLNRSYLDAYFEDLKIPLLIQTTDLLTGKGVVFDKGKLAEVVSASCSFFPLFSPILINKRYYMDGSFSNPTPIMEAVKRKAEVIMVVTVYDPPGKSSKSILDKWWNFLRKVDAHEAERDNAIALSNFTGKLINIDITLDECTEVWDVDCLPKIFKSFKEGLEKYKKVILEAVGKQK